MDLIGEDEKILDKWLRDTKLVRLCVNVSTPEFPLAAYEQGEQYRMYIADIGLPVILHGFENKKVFLKSKPKLNHVLLF